MTFSFTLGCVGVLGQILIAFHPRAGWGVSLLAQPLWAVFAVVTGQYGLLLMTPGYTFAAVINLRKAIRSRQTASLNDPGTSSAS